MTSARPSPSRTSRRRTAPSTSSARAAISSSRRPSPRQTRWLGRSQHVFRAMPRSKPGSTTPRFGRFARRWLPGWSAAAEADRLGDYTPRAEWPKGRKDMRLRLCATIFALALITLATGTAASASAAPTYYVSLGDSLAAGTQPGHFSTNESYTDQLFADLRAGRPTLQHVKLGCPGDATASMITPDLPFEGRNAHNPCQYPHGSQLAEAVSFLHAHQKFVALVTIDIGPNDLFRGGGGPVIANE